MVFEMANCTHILLSGRALKRLLLPFLFAISIKAFSIHQIPHKRIDISQRQICLIKGTVSEAVEKATIADVDLTDCVKSEDISEILTDERLVATAAEQPVRRLQIRDVFPFRKYVNKQLGLRKYVKKQWGVVENKQLGLRKYVKKQWGVVENKQLGLRKYVKKQLGFVDNKQLRLRKYVKKQLGFVERWKEELKTKVLVEEGAPATVESKEVEPSFKWRKAFSLKTVLKEKETLEQDALMEDVLEKQALKQIPRPIYVAPRTYASEKQPIHDWKTATPKPRDWFEAGIIALGFTKEMEYSTPVPCPLRASFYEMSTIRGEPIALSRDTTTVLPTLRRRILMKIKQRAGSGKRKLAINFNKTRLVLGKKSQITVQGTKITVGKMKIKVQRATDFCMRLYESESDFEKHVL